MHLSQSVLTVLGTATQVSEWGYNAHDGPLLWSSLNTIWGTCRTGRHQSPINLDNRVDGVVLGDTNEYHLQYASPLVDVPFYNTHHTVKLDVETNSKDSTLTFGGAIYTLESIHFHVPSEHQIRGESSSMEVHLVHKSRTPTPTLAVIGFAIEVSAGTSNAQLNTILSRARDAQPPGSNAGFSFPILYLDTIVQHFKRNLVYRYSGSLTTPPCEENVEWLFSAEPLAIDIGAFKIAKNVSGSNLRYIQSNPGVKNVLQEACSRK
ncbi:carbonic anhydrase [Mollisia scopiformis]|uniref:carbonic anhydrase n=1 Tax=Mollisia scopiformis TaxID=149040 RepID=A0A132B244_MOLSC|nr:carbonic anhydrase [Mollisia scopiformis]KUJ06313.1 carbonic anhydrase [Mollisia scopiformis]